MDFALLFLGLFPLYAALSWAFPGLLRPLWLGLLHLTYRFRVHNATNLPATGPALIVCNHVTYVDWMILWAACRRPVRFVLWAGYYKNPILRFFLSWVRHRTVRIDNRTARPHAVAESLAAVAAALDRGEVVVVFAEGRLTRNGQMRPFGRGVEHILKRCERDVPVIPVCTAGLWGSVFSHKHGRILRKLPENVRRDVSVWFGTPLPKTATVAELRAAVAEAQADLAVRESDRVLPPAVWFVRTACKFRSLFRTAFVDVATGTEKRLTFPQGLVACWCLAGWLRRRLIQGERRGVSPPVLRPWGNRSG